MDSKTLIKALKIAVRDVIKEELTEILREGLQSTINEMKKPTVINKQRTITKSIPEPSVSRNKVTFNKTGFADILNETPSLKEGSPSVSSFSEMMNENYQDLSFTSADAPGFGMLRKGQSPAAPQVMNDPETGKQFEVDPAVQKAMTRDYSALMKAIDKKKGR
jgi:hypothetical protein